MRNLIIAAEKKTKQQVVFLVDEYDAPLLDSLVNQRTFEKMRQTLRDFYSPLKAQDEHLKFVFISGITKFSQLSIFSELNNLNKISMSNAYAAICGITENELRTQIKPKIESMAESTGKSFEQICSELKWKYDGYHFSEKSPDIYNPFSLMKALYKKIIADYWFETGTPTVLTQAIKKYSLDPMDFDKGFAATPEMFDVPTETATDPIALLYQSGYLTIKGFEADSFMPYILAYPNDEVRSGFTKSLLVYYSGQGTSAYSTLISDIINGFKQHNIDFVMNSIRAYMSRVPYDAEK